MAASELLLPLPSSIYRQVSTEWAHWDVLLPHNKADIWHPVLVSAAEIAMAMIAMIIFVAVTPNPSYTKLAIFFVVFIPFFAWISLNLFRADFFITANRDHLEVCKMSRWLRSDTKRIRIDSCVDVGFVHRNGRRQLRVFTENYDLVFGEMLTLEEQNCLLSDIKGTYFSWGKVPF